MERYDFAIIGAGVVGAWTAFELSKCSDSVCVLEKENDCCMGTSKANSAIIHAGYDPAPGSLMARLNVRGNELVRQLHEKMSIPFKQIGSLVAAFDDEGMDKVRQLYDRGVANGVEGLELLDADGVRAIEPGIGDGCLGALYAPTAGICSAFDLTTAPLEIAILNGVVFKRNFNLTSIGEATGSDASAPVTDSTKTDASAQATDSTRADIYVPCAASAAPEDSSYHTLTAAGGETIAARIVINAAGVHADEIARLAGDDSITIHPRRGEYALLDKCAGTLARHVIFQPPTRKGKGVLVTPTVDGNLLVGPNACDTDDKNDVATTAAGQAEVFDGGRRSIPAIEKRDIINSFAGLRAVAEGGDFNIGFVGVNAHVSPSSSLCTDTSVALHTDGGDGSDCKSGTAACTADCSAACSDACSAASSSPWFLNIAGICSPGLSAAPAIGEYVVGLIEKEQITDAAGMPLIRRKERFADSRRVVRFMELSEDEKSELIRKNPLYGRVICRCESVTEGEIVDSILRPAGAVDMDGVKRRTRAGMGRCQSGFCGPKVMEILASELHMDYTDVTKCGRDSWMTLPSEKSPAKDSAQNPAQGTAQNPALRLHNGDNCNHRDYDGSCDNYDCGASGAPSNSKFQIVIIGGGPAGLSAAYECWQRGIRDILIIERDSRLGGILNQCIHPGFGLHVFGEELTGPEYAQRYINKIRETGIRTMTDSMVLSVAPDRTVQVMNRAHGVMNIRADAVILAMGCRERTRGMLQIPGTRPSGIYTAGTAQRLVNVEGYMPGREVVILGSGDIGLIMARRMTLEGARVRAVYEVMDHSGGLKRNIVQCLGDFGIPLYYSTTAVAIHGRERVTGLTVAKVDDSLRPIAGTEEYVPCDTVLISCGLIPENELTRAAGIEMDPKTRGPVDRGGFMTSVPGIFACGNVFKVYDLADNVTKDSILAGRAAAEYVIVGAQGGGVI